MSSLRMKGRKCERGERGIEEMEKGNEERK
jgi:hypothetical protein